MALLARVEKRKSTLLNSLSIGGGLGKGEANSAENAALFY